MKADSKVQDQIFHSNELKNKDFAFNGTVAKVFDDMVNRSVPFYEEIQRMVCELTETYAKPDSAVYDLGCSTGNTLIQLDDILSSSIGFVGIDDSETMLEKCKAKFRSREQSRKIKLLQQDLTKTKISNASVVLMVLVLQFIRPNKRRDIISKIYQGLQKDGVIILVEKVITEQPSFNRSFIGYYYDFKRRNDYSDLEIAHKREALENVLIPYRSSENVDLLYDTGFKEVEVFFRWYNFIGIIARKS